MLKELKMFFGENRKASTCRELTKKFEEFTRGSLGELVDYYNENEPRGEFVVVVAGANENEVEAETTVENISPVEYVQNLVNQGTNKKEAMRMAAKALNMSRRDIYQELLKQEKDI